MKTIKKLQPTKAMKDENLTMKGLVQNAKDCIRVGLSFSEWSKGMKLEYDLTNAHIKHVKDIINKKQKPTRDEVIKKTLKFGENITKITKGKKHGEVVIHFWPGLADIQQKVIVKVIGYK